MPRATIRVSQPAFAAEWMQQWREASVALAEQKSLELRTVTDEQALAATLALLEIGASLPIPPEREMSSGLVIQQAILHGTERIE